MDTPYSDSFFLHQKESSHTSAAQVVPVLLDLLHPRSVVDVGCGVGTWLAEFRRLGAEDILGIDGDYVNREMLQIPQDVFRPHDLTRPLVLGRKFDLAVSLEVAEHLPPDGAAQFVALLVSLAPAVLFSAAIPGQGGVNHVNERWQSYWADLFDQHGYVAVDCIRPRVWKNPEVLAYYSQNMVLYVRADNLQAFPQLIAAGSDTKQSLFNVVHPGIFQGLVHCTHGDNIPIRAAARQLVRSMRNAIRRRIRLASRHQDLGPRPK